MKITRSEWAVFWFTVAYIAGFSVWFLTIGNYEFIWYIVTMVVMIALVGFNLRVAEFPVGLLWALTLWGLAHMAGGGVPVGDSVLYAKVLVPLTENGELTMLKYDQLVHAYGFGVTAWLLFHILRRNHPGMQGGWSIYVYPAIGSMGLGSVNEIIEFAAVVSMSETGVGGYFNTALDLVFNAAGAIIAVIWLAARNRGEKTES
ncbi:DUF2238 domain-containing protein [Ostreiculturibacter nitratireducens]|uniref:DUF2238 domain-containing protein n=1 Tax=Ostreiculturibacter nitratireducens TaxID=3075226 RepID=UPI0031B64515